jgi:hypothetical protein
MSFGYIGTSPTQSDKSNDGVFSLKEHNKLREDFELAGGYPTDYLVVAGGAGGGSGHQNGGAGGAGGMRSTVDNKGGIAGVEDKLYIYPGKSYQIKIGGGSGCCRGSGGQSRFGRIVSIGGGGGYSGSSQSGYGGSAGGAGGSGTLHQHYSFADMKTEQEDADTNPNFKSFEPDFWYQGYDANGKGGGGAGAYNTGLQGAAGAYSNILPSTDASGYVGEVSGSDVYYAGGGGEGAATYGQNSNTVSYNNGGIGGGGNASQNGSANSGGGGGSGYVGGSGGSGVVIIRYPDTYPDITTIGAGLTSTLVTTGGYKIYTFTSGNDIITI